MIPFRSPELRIKQLSLGLEAKLIHQDERRIKEKRRRAFKSSNPLAAYTTMRLAEDFWSLRNHRLDMVRPAARDALLAYGFLRGRSYLEIERKRFTEPNWPAIEAMILKHGRRAGSQQDLKQSFERWKQEAGPVTKRP